MVMFTVPGNTHYQLVQWMWKHILGPNRGDQEQMRNERTGQGGLEQDKTGQGEQDNI